jgi:hypothetical protein
MPAPEPENFGWPAAFGPSGLIISGWTIFGWTIFGVRVYWASALFVKAPKASKVARPTVSNDQLRQNMI